MFHTFSLQRGLRGGVGFLTLTGLLCSVTACSPQASPSSEEGKYRVKISRVDPKTTWPKFDIYCTVGEVVPPDDKHPDGLRLLSTAEANKLHLTPRPDNVIGHHSSPDSKEPVYCLLLVDKSGSMDARIGGKDTPTKREIVEEGINACIKAMRPQDKCAIVAFGSTVPPVSDIEFFSKSETEKIRAQKEKLNGKGESTRLYDAIDVALDYITQKRPHDHTAVIVMTDGVNNCRMLGKGEHNNELLPGARLEDIDIKETDEARPGRKVVIDKALKMGVTLDTLGFGDKTKPLPNKAGGPEKYAVEMANYLDTATVEKIANVTKGHSKITDKPADLVDFYRARMNEYQLEQKIECDGAPDQLQDTDPGIYVEITGADSKPIRSNVEQLAYLVPPTPPPGSPHYNEFITRRAEAFGGIFIVLSVLWGVPFLMKSAFGSTVSSGDMRQRAVTREGATGYWQQQSGASPAQPGPSQPQPGWQQSQPGWQQAQPGQAQPGWQQPQGAPPQPGWQQPQQGQAQPGWQQPQQGQPQGQQPAWQQPQPGQPQGSLPTIMVSNNAGNQSQPGQQPAWQQPQPGQAQPAWQQPQPGQPQAQPGWQQPQGAPPQPGWQQPQPGQAQPGWQQPQQAAPGWNQAPQPAPGVNPNAPQQQVNWGTPAPAPGGQQPVQQPGAYPPGPQNPHP